MYIEIFTQLDLSKNEAKIYETLLREGECSVGKIAVKSEVNRRNVYDSLNRLTEKGLVFEIRQKNENLYKAVDPKKLLEVLKEKEQVLQAVMPNLEKMYGGVLHQEDVYVYRGLEGWKNYMRDIIRVGEDVYTIGGKGAWADKRITTFVEQFIKDAEKKKINFHMLFDHEIKDSQQGILKILESNHKFLPKGYSTPGTIDVFGDHVVFLVPFERSGQINASSSFTVIVNKDIAETFRIWFRFMWELSSKKK